MTLFSQLTVGHVIGVIVTFAIMTVVGLYAMRKVKSSEDFSVGGRKVSATVIAGTLMGTAIGGGATIGTSQMAFKYGLSAWWFTLGVGIGFLILGLFMARKLHESKVETAPQFLVGTYGNAIGPIVSIFTSIGIFLSIVANGLAFVALLTSIFDITPWAAALIGVALVFAYVLFGGVWGTGLVGVTKLIFLYFAILICGIMSYFMVGGMEGLLATFPMHPWFSLVGRSVNLDLAAGFSMIVGILSTQTYIQGVLSGKSVKEARKGTFISAVFSIPIGLGGVLVGLYMRAYFPSVNAASVFPIFIIKFINPFIAGVILATLLISAIGTWAGLTLGISTMMTKDIYKKFIRPKSSDKETLLTQRLVIVALCNITVIMVSGNVGSLILGWSFLSLGLRGCAALFPLLGAMYFKRWLTPAAGVTAALLGPLADLAWRLLYPTGLDPLYPGLIVSLVSLIIVSLFTKKSSPAVPVKKLEKA
jgi:solute:Na+ symporter, SSS family